MKLFISWSGATSHEVAKVFKEWLPYVLPKVELFLSSKDISKGVNWFSDIINKLNDSSFGIICLTKDNINSSWLNFEAGALGKSLEKYNVSPLLFDMKPSEIIGPLSQFQSTIIKNEDVYNLVKSINELSGSDKIDNSILQKNFKKLWPGLEELLKKIEVPNIDNEVLLESKKTNLVLNKEIIEYGEKGKYDEFYRDISNKINGIDYLISNKVIKKIEEITINIPRYYSQNITSILADVAKAFDGKLKMNILLESIVEKLMETMNAEVCSIFLNDEDNPNVIKCVAGSGFAEEIVDEARYEKNEGFTGTVFARGDKVNIRNRRELEALKDKKEWVGKFDYLQWKIYGGESQFKNLMACPLKLGNEIIGVIKVENKLSDKYFTDDDLVLFEIITNGVIAINIQNARLHQKTEAQAKALSDALNASADIAATAVSHSDTITLSREIAEKMIRILEAEAFSIFLKDSNEERDCVKCIAASGHAKALVGKAEYYLGEGLTGYVAESKRPIIIKSKKELIEQKKDKKWLGKYDELQWARGEFRNLIAVPLVTQGKTIGILKAENKKKTAHFTFEDVTALETIANIVLLALKKTIVYENV